MMETKRTLIRPATPEDAYLLQAWWRQKALMQPLGYPDGIETDIESLKKTLSPSSKAPSLFIIVDKTTEKPIGEVSHYAYQADNNTISFGIKIADLSYQNQGYAKEVLLTFIDYLFFSKHVHRIEIDTLEGNIKAMRLYESLGFNVIGVKREAFLDPYKNYKNVVLYDLLHTEWKRKD